MSESLPAAVAVVGPTGSGKATLGRELAQRVGLPMLVCDSVKVYRRLDIGSAKPSTQAQAEVEHGLIDLVDPDETFAAGDYARAAWERIGDGPALFVGGTGFYLRGTLWRQTGEGEGVIERSRDDPERRAFEARWTEAEAASGGATHRALMAVDPQTAGSMHPNNWVRVVRALWLCEQVGGPISAVRAADPPRARARLLLVVLDPGDDLRARLVRRLDRMLARGWLAEVETLIADGYDERHKAMRSLGYKQLVEVVRGKTSLPQAREEILKATWLYARRQRTYFRHQLPAEDVVHIPGAAAMPWDRVTAFLAPA
ncbi:MAG: tRNA (adenosine(37)-N6)-dimethylallyltransferase MiaA [Myxococcota bacterium]